MNILIIGVSGFIGRHLYNALSQQGHHVTGGSRNMMPNIRWQRLNFSQNERDWENQLQGIEVVINAVGIYKQSSTQKFSQIHDSGPKKLFDVCLKKNIKVIQISAIGAEKENPVTEFLKSKRNADQVLLESVAPNIVLYPGIVLGEKGASTRQLSLLARLICVPLAFDKSKTLPLISVYQLTDHIIGIINDWPKSKQADVLVAQPETMEQLLTQLRNWMGLGKGYFISVPEKLTDFIFWLFPTLSVGTFNKQSIDMLSEYSDSQYVPITKETASNSLLKNKVTNLFNTTMKLRMMFYFNLITLSLIWVLSGLVSIINIEQSRELISLVGMGGLGGDMFILSTALGDILLGVLLWLPKLRRRVIIIQIGIILIYSIIISIFMPMFWLHPFAPIIKNLAMVILALYLLVEVKG